jgi:hypothetical protein
VRVDVREVACSQSGPNLGQKCCFEVVCANEVNFEDYIGEKCHLNSQIKLLYFKHYDQYSHTYAKEDEEKTHEFLVSERASKCQIWLRH